MNCQLAPSILSCDPSRLADSVIEMAEGGADWIHFDVMDGQFVPVITFGDATVRALRPVCRTPFEAHLMTLTPDRHFEAFTSAGCSRIIFHAEATAHGHRLAQSLREAGVSPGVSINPGTPVQAVESLVEVVDLVLVMTVNPGWGGQSFIRECLPKIAALRRLRPDLRIEVDGGIVPETLCETRSAGADVFVTGSYLMRAPSIAAGLSELRAACG